MLSKDDIKAIVGAVSPLIDARASTTEILIKGEIKASEERIKEELGAEILAARAEAKTDSANLQAKLVKKVNDHESRITDLEKEAGIPHPHKH